ncbi:MAG: SDR family oxidoreductase, partial [Planctomycetaceae bacterium]|nr:SDR family oxidoreductase [Planctomycetaceae bacterium]
VVLNDRPGSPDLASGLASITDAGGAASGIEADCFGRDGCQLLLDETLRRHGRIDILVSNPAFSRRCSFLDYAPELFEQTLRGTLTAGFHMSQLVARQFVKQGGGGKIVFISSVQAELPIAGSVAYNAAKAGLNHMSATIATELAQHRINVNVIEPGWIDTPNERQTFSAEQIADEGRKLPWGRLGTPTDIGRAAAFLASDAADYVTGSVFVVDGGFRAKDWRPPPTV